MNEEHKQRGDALMALAEVITAFEAALTIRDWSLLSSGLGSDLDADAKDAAFHFRALYRILASNVSVVPAEGANDAL